MTRPIHERYANRIKKSNKQTLAANKTSLIWLLWRDPFSIGMYANGIKKFKQFLVFIKTLLSIVTKNQNKLYFTPNVTHKALS